MNLDLTTIYDQMPDFSSHEDARSWFKEQYPDRCFLRSEDVIEGKRVFFYHLVKDPEVYQQYMESFAKPEEHKITNPATFESYSTIEINEDGNVSFSI
ncbi:hypothetical protein SAMN05192533_107139 [Mesobacillus persicus]|uniref:Uncharacterized protein n=1 Tax=Mesobacillus persicus TaxID=930146 RepID=A0A1H8CLG5_9BACI|nr:hypothetical protein [Mesobacillus persicus]SEM95739.1 hypothetical protein SAMN05192533_107139 [Mesobacillus persicus]